MTTPQILQPIPPGDGSGGVLPSSFVIGDILYADSTSTLHTLAAVAAGSVLVSAGAGVAPAWSATSASKFGSVAIGGAAIGTNGLAITGTAAISGQIFAPDGTLPLPAYSFTSATSTGLYFSGGNIAVSNANVRVAQFNSSGIQTTRLDLSFGGTNIITAPSAGVTQFGTIDAAAPVAQTLGVQNVVAGTTNTAGAVTTIRGSAGTGTGLGGNIVFQYAPHGSTGTAQNAFATALTINGDTAAVTVVGALSAPTITGTVQLVCAASGPIYWSARSAMTSPSDGVIQFSTQGGSAFTALQFGGATASFPELKRSSAALQGRLADDSAFAQIQAKLTTDTNATTGLTAGVLSATTNASIVLYDGSGQAYRVPCII